VQQALNASREGEVNDKTSVSTSEDYQKVPQGVTVTLPRDKKNKGDASGRGTSPTNTISNGNEGTTSPKTEDDGGVEISKEELLKSCTYSWSTLLGGKLELTTLSEQRRASSFSILFLVVLRRGHALKS
jgi:hypothetical protein